MYRTSVFGVGRNPYSVTSDLRLRPSPPTLDNTLAYLSGDVDYGWCQPNPPGTYGRALKENEIYASKDGHAEMGINNPSVINVDGVEIIKGALRPGDQILAIGTSRNICHDCAKSLEGARLKPKGWWREVFS